MQMPKNMSAVSAKIAAGMPKVTGTIFFFQAEDGIRDDLVTGVQTCALPISEGRWVGVAWPEAFGGRGAGPVEHYIVTEELARARAPELVGRIGVNLVGPTLLAHGTPEQKARWLPSILDASAIWCQLFSEPGAGSDLTSLSTRAEKVDGG